MTTQTALAASRNRRKDSPDMSLDTLRDRIKTLHRKKNLDGVRDEAIQLLSMVELMQEKTDELAVHYETLRTKLEAMTAPEHYAVTITGVAMNGKLMVEVAGLGNARVQVAVHPDVDPEILQVGAAAVVSREKNCLLRVTAAMGRWNDVGTFERYLDSPHRILVRDRETLLAVDLAHGLRDTVLKKGDTLGFDRDVAGLAYERLESPTSDHLFDENVTDDFAQLGGLESEIAYVKEAVDFQLRYPDLAEKYALKSKCGILLQGPPGNGKTRIARCTAGYVRQLFPDLPCRFMHVSGASDYSMWFGETERKIVERFDAVREAAADGIVVMLWDEVDAVARRRGTDHGSGAPDRILNTFLAQLDGVVPLKNVVMLFATNRSDTLDAAFLRPGRTDQKIEIPPPNRRAAASILRSYLGRGLPLAAANDSDVLVAAIVSRLFAPNGDYAEVAQVKLSDGRRLPVAGRDLLSGAMLENVVSLAARHAAVREAESGQEGLSEQDLATVLQDQIAGAASLLTRENVTSYVKSIPQDAQPIAVESLLTSSTSTFMR
jgi:proteasome-associated ATPase